MITYPVTPETRWAVYQISSSEIIARNKPWPVADGGPIPGLDPDFTYLLQLTDAQPDYDPRLFTLEKTETIDAPANELRTSWSTVARPVEEVKLNIQNVEAVENSRHYSETERDKLMLLCIGVLFRLVANQQLTAKEIALKTRAIDIATRIWKNDARLRALFTAIDAGQPIDPDAGWEPTA